jgi:hypothetical protein
MKSFLNFIQYHNFAILIVVAIVGFGGSAFAATEVVKQLSNSDAPVVDTSALLSTDLDSFDMNFRIISATETDNGYIVVYSYHTLSLVDTSWQEIEKENTLHIEKTALLGTDINTYALTQLSEVVAQELSFLREVQSNELAEREKGSKVRSLAGLSLDALADLVHVERELPEIVEEDPVPEATVAEEVQVTEENTGEEEVVVTASTSTPSSNTSTASSTTEVTATSTAPKTTEVSTSAQDTEVHTDTTIPVADTEEGEDNIDNTTSSSTETSGN